MSVRPLCAGRDPVLRRQAREIQVVTDAVRQLARDLIETMHANDGIGLAAPQVGEDVQLFVAGPSQEPGCELVVINPIVVAARGHRVVTEGCLSLPNVWERVRRAAYIRMTGQDLSWKPLVVEAKGLMAVVIQHEVDHLHGRLFIDRLSWWRRRRLRARGVECRAIRSEWRSPAPTGRPRAGSLEPAGAALYAGPGGPQRCD